MSIKIENIKSELESEKIKAIIGEIRGQTPADKLKAGVDAIIKSDVEKAKVKAETDKKEKEEKLKAIADKIKTPPEVPDTEEEQEEEEEEDENPLVIKELTEKMAEMAKEIEALKKQKNYRTKPPAGKQVDDVDDFIKQNITKDFEVRVG